jgi:hypothetical protein
MFARKLAHIPSLEKNDEFHTPSGPQPVRSGGTGLTHDEVLLKWAQGLALVLFLVLIVLVISIAEK